MYRKVILISSLSCGIICASEAPNKGIFVAAVKETNKAVQDIIDKNLPSIDEAGKNIGSRFGMETLAYVGSGLYQGGQMALAGTKAAATAVVTSPYTVPTLAIGATAYVAYKATPHIKARLYPNKVQAQEQKEVSILQQEKKTNDCLTKNQSKPRNSMGIPKPCEEVLGTLALVGGREKALEKASTFKEFFPPKDK